MRAMDEFIEDDRGTHMTDAVLRSAGEALREAAKRADRKDAAIQQWEFVKRDCWRQP